MPNSASDLPSSNLYQPPYSSLAPLASSIKHAESVEEASESTSLHPTQSRQDVVAETNLDGSKGPTTPIGSEDHPKLDNLRSAITTSLGSPGGIEIDESPVHAGAMVGEDVKGALNGSRSPGKAEFPSERPANEPGHASSASFARAIPRDMDWGEDDKVDPEWNLQRSETDLFKLMAKSERTNSFPQVPPAHNPANSSFENALPQSQAGERVSRIQQTQNLFSEDDATDDFFSHVVEREAHPHTGASASETLFNEERKGGDDYGLAYGGEIPDEPEAESRYEEGLPLMEDSGPEDGQAMESGNADLALFADNGPGEEDDFFGGLAGSGESKVPPQFGRKSTMQVMDAFSFPLPEDPRPNPLDMPEAGDHQNAFDNATGGGVAASRSTVLSQVLGDGENKLPSQDEDKVLSTQEPSAEDLAAKWQAALAGDDLLDDELLEDSIPQSNTVDPAALFGSDDEGFLDDDEPIMDQHSAQQQISPPLPVPVVGSDGRTVRFDSLASNAFPHEINSNSRYIPPNTTQTPVQQSSNTFAPQAPLFTDLSAQPGQNSSAHGAGFGTGVAAPPPHSYGAPQLPKPDAVKSQSFADKSKGGYSSPYDLPMEVLKPRKRASMQQMARGYSNAPPPSTIPPPRSSSVVTQGPPPSRGSASSMLPPVASPTLHQGPIKPPQLPASTPQQALSPSLNSSGGFFAELPVVSRPKPVGRYTPQTSPSIGGEREFQTMPSAYHPPQAPVSQIAPTIQGLVAPPKVSPFAPLQTSQSQPPVVTSRYSPVPPLWSGSGSAPPPVVAGGRYATAPPLQQQQSSPYTPSAPITSPPAPILAHQPRTSSPLIHFERAPDQRSISGSGTEVATASVLRRESSSFDQAPRAYMPQGRMSPSKRATSSYAPDPRPTNPPYEPAFAPPQRSQTQSPGGFMAGSRVDIAVGEPYQRPVSVHSPTSPRQVNEHFPPINAGISKPPMREPYQAVNYIAPTDGREHDPLQRWRGGPIFAWGVGGTVITSFPKEVPRYGMGQTQPMIICSPGEVKVRSLKDTYPLEERLAGFPGPLKGKSKKKDLIAWLTAGIDMLERENIHLRSLVAITHVDKRKEERLLLWKILRVMIENDGLLEGNPVVEKAVRAVLSPGSDSDDHAAVPQYATASDLTGTLRATASTTMPEPVNPAAVDQLRQYLLRGEREKAVWEAVDKRLWAHALLISNTLSREVHKQVSQEFIQKEVKGVGENTESLAALYEIFAGNFEESVDELVPPSARAGLQMVSTSGTSGSSKSALDGLDRWRETLGLVLSNRSPEDVQAINALGKLLFGYGRAEAAHICFLFARGYSVFDGVDDPLSNIVLVGSDHLRQPYEFDKELEPTLLSEVYEYGLSLSTISNVSFSAPHLAVYKLQHASILAQFGQRDKALQYCDAIANSISSQVRRSPYHHALLISALDDLSKRLKQSPKDESSSWITKPSIDKVSGSLWGKFNKFVAGEDDGGSGGAGSEAGSEVGPFARIAGDTPIISRSPSNGDIYGSFTAAPPNGGIAHLPAMKSASRYAPGGSYTPPGAQDPSLSNSYGSPPRVPYAPRRSQEDSIRPEIHGFEKKGFGHQHGLNDQMSRSYPSSDSSLPSNSYEQSASQYLGSSYAPQQPAPPMHNEYTSLGQHDSPHSVPASESNLPSTGYIPTVSSGYEPPSTGTYEATSSGGYEPASGPGYEPPSSEEYEPPSSGGYEPPTSGSYEPPSSGGYEPPSYEPASMNDEPDSPIDTRPKKKSFIDDDDEPVTVTAGGNNKSETSKVEKSKAEKDREADEAFRKAAEADGKLIHNNVFTILTRFQPRKTLLRRPQRKDGD
jgi:COPII coat assembly protein SEC16